MLYKNLSGYLREKYGHRLKKICIDAGFSCPNRDGKVSTGGCIFCGERGAGEHIDAEKSIKEQVLSALADSREDDEFIAYFQNFTNTYADIKTLKERYDAALISDRIKILAIGTRPDCIDEKTAELIASYLEKCEVWVELGLQTASDESAIRMNRGYSRDVFEKAVEILSRYGIKTVVHLIVGLPGENSKDFTETAEYVSRFKPFGVKIHSIYVMRGTRLEKEYLEGRYTPPTLDEYASGAANILSRLSPDTVIHRLTGDCPRGMLVAPDWNESKHEILQKIEEKLVASGKRQGSDPFRTAGYSRFSQCYRKILCGVQRLRRRCE